MNDSLVISPVDFVGITNNSLEHAMPYITIEGELSELRIRKERWLYFKIKDDYATVSCFGVAHMLPGPVEDGMMIKVSGSPRLHQQFGFSFNAQQIAVSGQGSLHKAYELLKLKLAAEGLLKSERKRVVRDIPDKIALVTSAEGAAVADFIKIAGARWPLADIDVFDCLVQGSNSPGSVMSALDRANGGDYDVIVVTRGGGGAEDLAAFNDEKLVRAVAASKIPVMAAIGHEVDESLTELAADMRASTPSNAAELLLPDSSSELRQLAHYDQLLGTVLEANLSKQRQIVTDLRRYIDQGLESALEIQKQYLNNSSTKLKLLNPRNILERGYSITSQNGVVVKSRQGLKSGSMQIEFADGKIAAKINIDKG